MVRRVWLPAGWLMAFWLWILAMGSAAAGPAEGRDQEVRVAILPLVFEGGSAVARERIEAGIVEGLGRGDIEAVPSAEVLAAAPEARACSTADCYRSVAREISVSHVLRAKVEGAEREYGITFELFEGGSGDILATSTDSCEICGLVEAVELAADRAAGLHNKLVALPAGPGILAIRTAPAGALVRIDGRKMGSTPIDVELEEGEHTLVIQKDDYTTLERTVSAVSGVREIVTFELTEAPDVTRRRSTWGWLAIGTGIASTAAGATLIGLHHQPYKLGCDDEEDEDGLCPLRYDTLVGGIVLTSVGVAAVTTGIVLVVRARKGGKGRRSRGRRAHRFGPAAGGIAFSF